jgi:hypothetical protein
MKLDEIDEALRRTPAWEPPPGFARRVTRLSRSAQLAEPPVRFLAVVRQFPTHAYNLILDASTMLAGFRWMLRQYRLLLAR